MGNPVDLLFQRAPYAGGPVDLVFGGSNTGSVIPPVNLSLAATLPGPTLTATVQYQSRTQRPTVGQTSTSWQPARETDTGIAQGQQDTRAAPAGWAAFWQRTLSTPVSTQVVIPDTFTFAPVLYIARHQDASGLHTAARLINQSATRADQTRQGVFQNATPARHATAFRHQDADRSKRAALSLWWQTADQIARGYTSDFQPATALHPSWRSRYQDAQVPPPGRAPWPPILPPLVPRVPNTDLLFACPPWLGGAVHLLFGRVCGGQPPEPGAPLFILPARFYMAVHSLAAQRLPDLASVPIFDVSLSADAGSFAWTFSASGPASLFDQLAPTAGLPAQIRITLDGAPFVFVVDSIAQEERFGQRGARISGRSVTALLARPYAREASRSNTTDALAQQLALEALDATGVGLDWGLTDWLVPTGAWSSLATPLAAVQAIVEAAGGYIQSHRSAATLLARHPYPELAGGLPGGPWNWYAPGVIANVELAPDALITQRIERRDGPDINGVYVSGTTQGVIALVKRIGSAADKLASLQTDPLITAQEAALQRGLATLGAAGPKHLVQLDLPVLTGAGQPGVLDVGQLVQVNTAQPWRGRVRAVSVNAKLPSVRQSVQIERHLEIV